MAWQCGVGAAATGVVHVARVVVHTRVKAGVGSRCIVIDDQGFASELCEVDQEVGTLGRAHIQTVVQHVEHRHNAAQLLVGNRCGRDHIGGGQETTFGTNLDDVRTDGRGVGNTTRTTVIGVDLIGWVGGWQHSVHHLHFGVDRDHQLGAVAGLAVDGVTGSSGAVIATHVVNDHCHDGASGVING